MPREMARPAVSWTLLLLLTALALCIRALWLADAFGPDGGVTFWGPDATYHARRALYSFVRFPEVLWFDPYLAFPKGAVVPMPPLFDWAIAAVARCFGHSEQTFERVAAWASPVLAAATVPAVWALGRSVGGPGVGLGAAALFAALPAHVFPGIVGNVDHHAALGLLGSLQLLAILTLAGPAPAARVAWLSAALLFLRVALALTWSGSLLYLGLGEALLLGSAWATREGRGRLLCGQAGGAGGAALLLAAFVALAPTPAGGAFSTTTLSWFHVAALALAAAAGLASLALEALQRRVEPPLRRLLPIGFAAAAALVLLSLAWLGREDLAPVIAFLTKRDLWGELNLEQRPLLRWPWLPSDAKVAPGFDVYGPFAVFVPLAWLGPLLYSQYSHAGAPSARRFVLASWLLVFGALTAMQIRFLNDFGPGASVGFALWIAAVVRAVCSRLRLPPVALAIAAGAALTAPSVAETWLRQVPRALAFVRDGLSTAKYAGHSLARFGALVRSSTPETSGYLDQHARPEYGVLCRPALGHVFLYAARRATPAGNFGPYTDPEKLRLARRFYEVNTEGDALAIARALGVRYVLTIERGAPGLGRFVDRLHVQDGSTLNGVPHAGRFRLAVEGPEGGMPFPQEMLGRQLRTRMPYKLFEVVEGAVLTVEAAHGTRVMASTTIVSSSGRRFPFEATTDAGPEGEARLRVPYPTEASGGAWAEGPYRVRAGIATGRAYVGNADVQEGKPVSVELTAPADR